MEAIKPTQFNHVNVNEMLNSEQLLCGKAVDAVIALGLFDADQFYYVNTFATNHLLKWCMEVLTAYEFDFFKKVKDEKQNCLVGALKENFTIHYMLSINLSYEIAH